MKINITKKEYGTLLEMLEIASWVLFSHKIDEDPETKNLTLRYEDLDTGDLKKHEVELLVLATGIIPNNRNKRLAKVLKIELDELGYFKEKDPLLAPLATKVDGIYLCGGATGPIDIAESVSQATAAAMKAVSQV